MIDRDAPKVAPVAPVAPLGGKTTRMVDKQPPAPRPQGIGSVHGCQCDSCNMFRLIGQ
jgi:hypothetical protein